MSVQQIFAMAEASCVTRRVRCQQLTFFPTVQPTHCVVDFTEENNFSLVPVKKLNIPVASIEAGCDCMVEWGKKKQLFKTTVTGLGKFSAMALVKFIPSELQ